MRGLNDFFAETLYCNDFDVGGAVDLYGNVQFAHRGLAAPARGMEHAEIRVIGFDAIGETRIERRFEHVGRNRQNALQQVQFIESRTPAHIGSTENGAGAAPEFHAPNKSAAAPKAS